MVKPSPYISCGSAHSIFQILHLHIFRSHLRPAGQAAQAAPHTHGAAAFLNHAYHVIGKAAVILPVRKIFIHPDMDQPACFKTGSSPSRYSFQSFCTRSTVPFYPNQADPHYPARPPGHIPGKSLSTPGCGRACQFQGSPAPLFLPQNG